MGEEKAVVIDLKTEGQSDGGKSVGKKIQMGGEIFQFVKLGAGEKAAVVVDQLEERGLIIFGGDPAMRGSVVLPELADILHLPAAGRLRFLIVGGIGSEIVLQRPAADGSAVQFEIVAAQDFGSGQAVGNRRTGGEKFFQESDDKGWPGFAMIAAGGLGRPGGGEAGGDGFEIAVAQTVEMALGNLGLLNRY